jgi:hypothetical protein
MTLKLTTLVAIFTSVLFVSAFLGLAKSSTFDDGHQHGITSEGQIEDSAVTPVEMRASIVDKDGDQFIARTEEGEEFRLPVEGAPENINVGDELRLIPDSESQTIQVFKAEPQETGGKRQSNSQL